MIREKDTNNTKEQKEIVSNEALKVFSNQNISRFQDKIKRASIIMVEYMPYKNNTYSKNRTTPTYGVVYVEEIDKDMLNPKFSDSIRVFEYNPLDHETKKVIGWVGISEIKILSSYEKEKVMTYLDSLSSAYC